MRVMPSGRLRRVARIVSNRGNLPGRDGRVDHGHARRRGRRARGDLISRAAPAEVADQFEATVVWMGEEPMLPAAATCCKIGTRRSTRTIAPLKYKLNVNTLEHVAATRSS